MELQELSWLCMVALFLASLLIVLGWLLQYSLTVLRLWKSRKTAKQGGRETTWLQKQQQQQHVFFTLPQQIQAEGIWGFLQRKLHSGKDGGTASEAGVKGLLTSLFSFRSFKEHWQRTWVKALNEQACRHGVS
ncbi:hypothetical protein ILYODFUR_000406 [Ilyodon furcidens]|uniref:ATP synthase F0 subunit 8 n=1 Tax=Ilyodon furcidens TaxID=33524 RepID=A0ABV0SJ57_9TELE